MKKSSLTSAVVAGIVGAAGLVSVSNAVNINPDGLGQVLIYPYYTVNGGNATLVSVVNTTNQVKAVKVRFLEGRNSREVLDFNLYLSPFDVWTGSVIGAPEGTTNAAAFAGSAAATLSTSDTSCTVPAIPAAGQAFVNYDYALGTGKDTGPYEVSRTREGHLEIIEMGRVIDQAPFLSATAATHAANGRPANCQVLLNAWSPSAPTAQQYWRTNANDNIQTPNGGLFGGAVIVDVANGTSLSYNADAIDGFFQPDTACAPNCTEIAGENLHANPGTVDPSLKDARTDVTGGANAIVFNNGTLYQFPFTGANAGLRAVSAVFMHNELYNEYNSASSTGVSAQSEWVVTFPTKRLHIQQATIDARLPFRSQYQGGVSTSATPYSGLVGACEPISADFWNREELAPGFQPGDLIFSPPPPPEEAPGLNLCFEAQVITFNQPTAGDVLRGNQPSGILGSYYPRNLNLCSTYTATGTCAASASQFNEGWVRLGLGNPALNFLYASATPITTNPGSANALTGLPATGFWAANFTATGTPGVLANFSLLHKHRADRNTAAVIVTGAGGSGDVTWVPAGSAL
jgi:hypothetical protein